MTAEENLIRQELLKLISASSDNIKIAEVISVNDTKKTCQVRILQNDLEATARLRASENGQAKGIWLTPKVGSTVVIGRMNQFKRHVVLMCDEIDALKVVCDAVEFNGGTLGGLVKSEAVNTAVNEIKDSVNALKNIINTWVPVPNDGGLALKTALVTWTSESLAPSVKTDFENSKIKH